MPAHLHALQANPERAADESGVQRDHRAHADETEFLGEHRQDEVGVRLGQVRQLLHRRTEADTEPFTATDRHQRIRQLVAGIERVGPRIEERLQAADAIRFCDRHDRERRQQHQHRSEHPRHVDATEHQHAGGDRQQQRGRTEVRLREQQADQQQGHAERLEHRHPGRADVFAVTLEIAGEPDDIEQLDRLHRLEIRDPQVDPAARAVDAATDARHEHQQQQYHAHQQQPLVLLLDGLELGAHQPQRQRDAAGEEHDVADQIVERADIVGLADRDRAGAHHHHAQARQRARGAQQPRIEVADDRVEPGRLAWRLA